MRPSGLSVVPLLLFVVVACAESPYELKGRQEWILLGAGGALGVTSLILMENVEPLTPEAIAQLDPGDINGFDRRGVNEFRETRAGDGFLYASYLLPLTFLVGGETRQDWRTLGVLWAEVTLFNLSLNGVTKASVKRTRPYVYDPDTPLERKTTVTARLSFYSGHTASAAANSFFVAKVFQDYLESTRARALIWVGAALYPSATAFLRRDSGHHFRTDVITGYVAGALFGYFIPELHRIRGDRISVYPTTLDRSPALALRFGF
jgi:membrane-associated phospholipid phosphatase